MSERAIADTSALIALEKINLLDVLCRIYSEIILPEAVINEFGTPPIKWIASVFPVVWPKAPTVGATGFSERIKMIKIPCIRFSAVLQQGRSMLLNDKS